VALYQLIRGIHMTFSKSGLRTLLMLLGFTAALAFGQVAASEMKGTAVLTVAGKITETNRPVFNALSDAFFNFHKRKFERAFQFDIASLEALGMQKATINYPGWPRPVTVEGPFLRDVLAAAGAEAGIVRITALDGFTADLAAADMAEQDWIVALKADGQYLGIGGKGPSWVLYARRDGKPATAEDEERWPWAAFLIEVN
jgi:hypothetical protein